MAVLLAAIYALVAVLAHAAWCRLPPDLSSVPKMVVTGAIVGAGLAAHLLALYGVTTATLAGLLTYGLTDLADSVQEYQAAKNKSDGIELPMPAAALTPGAAPAV